MGQAAYDASPEARAVFDAADKALGESLSGLCFNGPEDALKLTANTQPAILTCSVALLRGVGRERRYRRRPQSRRVFRKCGCGDSEL